MLAGIEVPYFSTLNFINDTEYWNYRRRTITVSRIEFLYSMRVYNQGLYVLRHNDRDRMVCVILKTNKTLKYNSADSRARLVLKFKPEWILKLIKKIFTIFGSCLDFQLIFKVVKVWFPSGLHGADLRLPSPAWFHEKARTFIYLRP